MKRWRKEKMAKKIRFSLEMEQGVEVRSLEELRENFSLERVVFYLINGKLTTWLRDRYANDIADAIEELDTTDAELGKKISAIFDVSYDEEKTVDFEKAAERIRKLSILKEYTTEQKYVDVVENIAFEQDDIYDLLDEDVEEIYLCGERFSIPLAKTGVSYIGINAPIVVIDSKIEVDWSKKGIKLENVIFDENYKAILTSMNTSEQDSHEDVDKNEFKEKDMKKILAYLDINDELRAKDLYEYDSGVLFCEHKMRKQLDNDHRDSSIFYIFYDDTKEVKYFRHFHEQDFQSQRIEKWLIYEDNIFYVSSCQRGLWCYLKTYNLKTEKIRTIDSWEGSYAWTETILEITEKKLRYGTTRYGTPYNLPKEIIYEKHFQLY